MEAYLIKKEHFDVEEVNYPELKKYTNNIILEHINQSGSDLYYFKRSLYELRRLDYNIGILLNTDNILSQKQLIKNLIWNLKGFKINLGIWITGVLKESVYNELKDEFSNNFILGLVSEEYTSNFIPRWGNKGDIEELESIKINFIRKPILKLSLNTDYKTIYEENDLKYIPY